MTARPAYVLHHCKPCCAGQGPPAGRTLNTAGSRCRACAGQLAHVKRSSSTYIGLHLVIATGSCAGLAVGDALHVLACAGGGACLAACMHAHALQQPCLGFMLSVSCTGQAELRCYCHVQDSSEQGLLSPCLLQQPQQCEWDSQRLLKIITDIESHSFFRPCLGSPLVAQVVS